jgi:hypothetical protein
MSGPERQAPDDKLLEDFLEGRSPASRAWREAMRDEAAPPEMDEAVLGMARRDIEAAAARPPSRDRFRDRRWPFALAAVLVLSFSTLLTIVQDPVAYKEAMMAPPAAAPSAAVVLPEVAPQAADALPAQPREAAPLRRAEPLPARPAAPKSAMSAGSADAMHDRAEAATPPEAPAAATAPAPPPPAAAPAMEEFREEAPAELESAPSREMLRQHAAPPSFMGAAKLKREAAESDAADREASERRAADDRGVQADAADAELARIRRLLAEGREAEARQALAAWRRNWPQRPVPEDLQRLQQ